MPLLKTILTKQASIPGNIEAGLPTMAPKISQFLISAAEALPLNPDLPEIPIAPGGDPPTGVLDIIKGIDDALPDLPEFGTAPTVPNGALKRSGYRSTPPSLAPRAKVIMGGGYRSI